MIFSLSISQSVLKRVGADGNIIKHDGDYQSCYTCDEYVSCSSGILTNRTCQEGHPDKPLFWNDVKKRCDEHYRTCHPSYTFD